ncbi:MAG: hypothetical protein Q9171_004997 [Xanthocarpia ochracea]
MATSGSRPRPTSNLPVIANFDSTHLTIGAGVAIFHLATSRVVVCYHSEHKYWFLPKGRRDAGEDSGTGAEREGFEEVCISLSIMNTLTLPQSGYRNRLLPIPLRHRQPQAHNSDSAMSSFVTEPVWTQLMPVTRSAQYMLFWYIAETLPPEIDHSLSQKSIQANDVYIVPPRYPEALTLSERIEFDKGLTPVRHDDTGVNEDEALYESYLLSTDDAQQKLSGTIMADVTWKNGDEVRKGKVDYETCCITMPIKTSEYINKSTLSNPASSEVEDNEDDNILDGNQDGTILEGNQVVTTLEGSEDDATPQDQSSQW